MLTKDNTQKRTLANRKSSFFMFIGESGLEGINSLKYPYTKNVRILLGVGGGQE